MGILTSIAVPRLSRTLELTKASVAVANLRAILTAERIYWLESRKYTDDLDTFVGRIDTPQFNGLLDRFIVHPDPRTKPPYRYEVDLDGDYPDCIKIKAIRQNSDSYTGELILTHEGDLDVDTQIRCGNEGILDKYDLE